MKRFIFALISVLLLGAGTLFAGNQVELVSFDQGGYDSMATLALKNNTDTHLQKISFIIEYLEMDGTPSDYKEFTEEIDIAPHMTRKFNIPAYERSRQYYYHKSEKAYGGKPFRIRFQPVNCVFSGSEVNMEPVQTMDVTEEVDIPDESHKQSDRVFVFTATPLQLGIVIALLVVLLILLFRALFISRR